MCDPTCLGFPGGLVDTTGFRTDSAPPRSTSTPELVGDVFRRVVGELDALIDSTEPGTPGRETAAAVRSALRAALETDGAS